MYDGYGRCVPCDKFKKTGYIILYDRSGLPINVVRLKGMFPMRFPEFLLSYESNRELIYHIDFSVDDVTMGLDPASELVQGISTAVGGLLQ